MIRRIVLAIVALGPCACLFADNLEDACGYALDDLGRGDVEAEGTAEIEGGSTLDFDGASAVLSYSDNAGDENCIFEAQITLQKGGEFSGCQLDIHTVPQVDEDGALLISRVELSKTDDCPTWDFEDGGSTMGDGPFGKITTPGAVKGADVEACYDDIVEIELDRLELERVGNIMVLAPSTITLRGSFTVFAEEASCPTPA